MFRNARARLLAALVAVAATVVTVLGAAPARADTETVFTASPTTVTVGDTVTFTYAVPDGSVSATNWIGFYSGTSTPGHGTSAYWKYTLTGGTSAPPSGSTGLASGTISFSTAGWAAGSYTAYLLYNDGYTVLGTPLTVLVLPASLSVPAPDVLDVDFAAGTATDHAGGLAATPVGSPTIAADAALGRSVATFNGSSDAYQFDFSSAYSRLTSHLTLECQFRWNGPALSTYAAGAYPSVCSGEQSGGVNIEVYNNALNASINVGGYKYAYAPAAAVVPGRWYDAVATWDGADLRFYLDGTLVATTAAAGTMTLPAAAARKWTLGADVTGSGGTEAYAPVSLASSRIWSTALTNDQVVAQFHASQANPITVTRSGQGTAAASTPAGHAGDTVTLSAQPADGYTFTGWQVVSPADGSVTIAADGSFTMPGVPVTVQATFTPNTYTVHFDGNGAGAGAVADQDFTYDESQALRANAFTRPGYTFAGWATSPGATAVYSDAASVSNLAASGMVTLYAVWHAAVPAPVSVPSPDVLDVDFASGAPVDHASGLAATTTGAPVVASDAALAANVATFNGSSDAYQFDFSSAYSRLTSHLTLECQFRWNGPALSTYVASAYPSVCSGEQSGGVNIEVYQNKLNASINVGGYKYAYAPAAAVVPGRWYDAVATWDGANLRFYLDGTLVATTAAAGTMTLPAAAARKWTLGADVTGSGGTEAYAPVSLANSRLWSTALGAEQVAALSARAYPHPVTVTRSGQGTAAASPGTAYLGTTVTLTQQAETGYHFTGWQVVDPADGSVGIGSDATFTMPAAAVTVGATFTANAYTVRFDGNGAEAGTVADEAFTYDLAAALTANTFTRDGYAFAGWATSATGRPVYADGASVSNLAAADGATVDLYAVWVPEGEYLVLVDAADHGTAAADNWAAAPGTTVTLTATPDPGYHLAGWQVVSPTDAGVTIAADGTFTMPPASVEVAPSFAVNTYAVVFDGNGADGGSMATVALTYDQSAALPAGAFYHDGYVFAGWATSAAGTVAYPDGATVENLTADDGATVTLYAVWAQQQTSPGSWPSLAAGFVTDTFLAPAVRVSGAVSQPLLGLWNGPAPTSFTKVSGDSWLDVSAAGLVTGTAPAGVPAHYGEITVSATAGTTTSRILVEIPVDAADAAPQLLAATWNTWEGGSHVTDALGKQLAVIAASGLSVIGFQEDGADAAQRVASALGWHVYGSGELGLVSAYPIAGAGRVAPTGQAPALGATVTVEGHQIRVWDAYLDESATDTAARESQALSVAAGLAPDLASAGTTPVLLLGDLGAASLSSTFTAAGLTDSYSEAKPQSTAVTWPLFATPAVTAGRVDAVDYAGGLHVLDSETLTAGWPAAASTSTAWSSDHAAVATLFAVGDGGVTAAPSQPTVTVATNVVGYQVDHGPDPQAFLADVAAAADPAGAVLSADLSGVDFAAAGWGTARVTATRDGVTSDAVAVAVRVKAAPGLTLGSTTATLDAGDTIDAAHLLAQLQPLVDEPATLGVDLTSLTPPTAGSHTVTVTATDEWGISSSATATVVINSVPVAIVVAAGAHGSAITPVATADPGTQVTVSAVADAGYHLSGWQVIAPEGLTVSTDPQAGTGTFTMPAADVSLQAAFAPNTYTVHFDGNGATDGQTAEKTLTYDTAAALTANGYTRTGYTFAGWNSAADGSGTPYDDAATVSNLATGDGASVTLYAVWATIDYSISYDLADGTAPAGNPASYTVASQAITLTNPTRTGYAFTGWTGTGLDGAAATVTIATGSTGDRSYTATWAPVAYAISFDLAGGTVAQPGNPTLYTVESDAITLVNPARAGYTFAGWTGTGLDAASTDVTIAAGSTGDRSYTATWSPVTYTVHFDPNAAGVSGATPDQTLTYDTPRPLTPAGFLRDGHAFAGWATAADGPVAYQDGATVTNLRAAQGATVTLYAVWTVPVLHIPAAALVTGSTVTISGTGFSPHEQVRVEARPGPVALTTAAADASGAFSVTVTVPGSLTPGVTVIAAAGQSSRTTVTQTTTQASAWAATSVYNTGDLVVSNGSMWRAQWWTQNQKPGDPTGPWEEMKVTTDGQVVWTASRVFDKGGRALHDGSTWEALWWTRNQRPGDVNGPWQQMVTNPDGTAVWTPTRQFTTGDVVTYGGARYLARADSRNVAPSATGWAWQPTT